MKTWNNVFSSAVFRLIVIVLAVVIPLNLLTLVLGNTVIAEVERQVSLETQGALQMYMNQMDDAVYRIGTKMYMLAHSDEDFSRLNEKEVTSLDEYYRQVQSVVRLDITMENILEDYSLIGGIYAYFPKKNYFVQQGGTSTQNIALSDFVAKAAKEDHQDGWQIVDVAGEPLLLLISNYRNAYYGAWISLYALAQKLNLSSTEEGVLHALIGTDGTVYQASSPEVSKLNLRLDNEDYLGENYVVVRAQSQRTELCYVRIIFKSQMTNALPAAIRLLQILSVVSVLIIPIIVAAMRYWIVRPVNLLTKAMARIEQGDVDYRIPQSKVGSEFDLINCNFNRMMDEMSELKISIYEQQLKTDQIRLGFLSQQIQPHFILNALNILYSYEPEEYPLIQKMILCLSKYFRYVVNANADFVELGQELKHIQNYFDIQQARFLSAFHAEIVCAPETEDCLIPPLIVQNFTENAIKHALVPGEMVSISVRTWKTKEKLYISICDTGMGIPEEVLARIEEFRRTREFREDLGIGIQNAIDRLEIVYGVDASLNISRQDPQGTRIDIELPIKYR